MVPRQSGAAPENSRSTPHLQTAGHVTASKQAARLAPKQGCSVRRDEVAVGARAEGGHLQQIVAQRHVGDGEALAHDAALPEQLLNLQRRLPFDALQWLSLKAPRQPQAQSVCVCLLLNSGAPKSLGS